MVRANSKKPKSKAITYKGFFNLPNVLLNHPDFISLSPRAVKLLIDIGAQYNGFNNGDLCASISLMKYRGWSSRDQLNKAKRELLEREWIIETKMGGFRMGPCLYAISWQPIDDCDGKLDLKATTRAPRSLKPFPTH